MMLFQKSLRAFSTPEVLLSIFLVSIGLVTIMAVMSQSLRYSYKNQDVIIATDLAQEGIELIRNVRDNNFATGGTGFAAFSSNRHCRIDWNDSSASLDCQGSQGTASRYYLQYAGSPATYAHFGTGEGRYSRYIYIDYTNNAQGERALVRSFVFWGNGTLPPTNGNASGCTNATSCVFSETFLTAWK